MTPREAFAFLMAQARHKDASPELIEAVGIVQDHTTRLEQFSQLVISSIRSAERDLPELATMNKHPWILKKKQSG